MADGDRAAVYVDLVYIPAEILADREGLRGKRLVRLDAVELVDGHIRLGERLAGGGNGANAHYAGLNARGSADYELRHGLNAELGSLFGAHYNDCGSAVVDAGGVARGNGAVLLEGGAELSKRFHGGTGTVVLVLLELDHLLLDLYHYGNDLLIELALFLSLGGVLLGTESELILHFAGDAPLLGNVFCGDAHVVIVERLPEAVLYHHIDNVRGGHAHAVAVARLGDGISGGAHVLHAANHHAVRLAGHYHGGGKVDGLKTGTAYVVDGLRGDLHGDARLDGRLTSDALAEAALQYAAHNDLVNVGGVYARAADGFLYDDGAQLNGGDVLQRTSEGTDGGTDGARNNNFLRHIQYTSNDIL